MKRKIEMKNGKLRTIALLMVTCSLLMVNCDDGNNGNGETHSHTPAATWTSNAAQHWRECTANDGAKIDAANHTAGDWITDTHATETIPGSKHKECTVCQYVTATEAIPATGIGHTHTPAATWTSNAAQHWRECTANDGAKIDAANHTGNPCTVCGYESGGLTVENIKLPKISEIENLVDAKMLFLTKLAEQSEAIQAVCQTEQNPTGFTDYLGSAQFNLFYVLRNGTNMASINYDVIAFIDSLVPTIAGQFKNNGVNTAHLSAQIEAFRTANTIAQRQLSNVVPQNNQETALLAQLAGLGIIATDTADAIAQLRQALEASMLRDYNKYVPIILQQWEDCAEFSGWVQDLQASNGSLYVPDPRTPTRSATQASNGR